MNTLPNYSQPHPYQSAPASPPLPEQTAHSGRSRPQPKVHSSQELSPSSTTVAGSRESRVYGHSRPASTASQATPAYPRPIESDVPPPQQADAARLPYIKQHPKLAAEATKWMRQHIRTHLRQDVDPGRLRLLAFSSAQAANALDTRHLVSNMTLTQLAVSQREQPIIRLLSEGRQMGIYTKEQLQDPQARFSTDTGAAAGAGQGADRTLVHSRLSATQLVDAMNGLTPYEGNLIGGLFAQHHVPASPEIKRHYIRSYIQQLCGVDVDPDNTYLVDFTKPGDTTGSAAGNANKAALFARTEAQSGRTLMELFEWHMAPPRRLPDLTGYFRIVTENDFQKAEVIARNATNPVMKASADWATPALDASRLLNSLEAIHKKPHMLFDNQFRAKNEVYWQQHRDGFGAVERERARNYAMQALHSGALSPQQHSLVDGVLSGDDRPQHVQVFPVVFPSLPTSDPFIAFRIVDEATNTQFVYHPAGKEAFKAITAATPQEQQEQIKQWLGDKVAADVWRREVTQVQPANVDSFDNTFFAQRAVHNRTALGIDVFGDLAQMRIDAETKAPVASAGVFPRVLPIERIGNKWNNIAAEDFADLDLEDKRVLVLGQYPPLKALASEYARRYIRQHLGREINPDTTYLTVFPKEDFFQQVANGYGRDQALLSLPGSDSDGHPARTDTFEKKISLTELFIQNWDPELASLLKRNKRWRVKILSENQLAAPGERRDYKDAVDTLDVNDLFTRMSSVGSYGNRFVEYYKPLLKTFWDKHTDHVAAIGIDTALDALQVGAASRRLTPYVTNLLTEALQGDASSGATVMPLHIGDVDSHSALRIQDPHGPRNWLYLPNDEEQPFREFGSDETLSSWILQQAQDPEWRDRFAYRYFSRNDADNRTADFQKLGVRKILTEKGSPYNPQGHADALGIRRTQALRAPFVELARNMAQRDQEDLAFSGNDNRELELSSALADLNAFPFLPVGNVLSLFIGKGEEKRTALLGLASEAIGLAAGTLASRSVGLGLKPLLSNGVAAWLSSGAALGATDFAASTAAECGVGKVLEKYPGMASGDRNPFDQAPYLLAGALTPLPDSDDEALQDDAPEIVIAARRR